MHNLMFNPIERPVSAEDARRRAHTSNAQTAESRWATGSCEIGSGVRSKKRDVEWKGIGISADYAGWCLIGPVVPCLIARTSRHG